MYSLVLIIPFLGTAIAGLGGRYIGGDGAVRITTSCIALAWLVSVFIFIEVGLTGSVCLVPLGTWIFAESGDIHWGLLFDSLTSVMLLVVTTVATFVHLYSGEYMAGDPHRARFMSYLSLFTFFMLVLVTGDNLLQLFFGWEGIGLSSYLLINFWYGRIQANKAAVKAMVLNRVGDLGLAVGIFLIYNTFSSIDYGVIFSLAPTLTLAPNYLPGTSIPILEVMVILLFIGAVGKSAQIGLHTWLPDAMEGPTPVSALIHAATLVTAGVFLLCRCSSILSLAPISSNIIALMGGATAFLAASIGLCQNDLKRVIAYSTCSQLGYMVFAVGVGAYGASVFHLANHAIFKALLFLGAGSVIHALGDEQDLRRMGGLVRILPLTYATMGIGSLALLGFPFLTGFYSKDVVLEAAYSSFTLEGRVAHTLGVAAAFCTAYYSLRLLALTFLRPVNGLRQAYSGAHEPGLNMALPLIVLSIGSIFLGYTARDLFLGMGTDFWGNALFVSPEDPVLLAGEWLDAGTKGIPLVGAFAGVFFAVVGHLWAYDVLIGLWMTKLGRSIYTFLNRKWFFDKVYGERIFGPALSLSYRWTYLTLDRGLLEFLGPESLSNLSVKTTGALTSNSISFVYRVISTFVGVTILAVLALMLPYTMFTSVVLVTLLTIAVIYVTV